jgi:transcriptional regulator with XRE-family HTH domain
MYKSWGARLRSRRIAVGLTQQALADQIGTTKAHVSAIERGKTSVGDAVRMRIAAALGTTTAELFPYPDAIPA